jgi:hypothetical protein
MVAASHSYSQQLLKFTPEGHPDFKTLTVVLGQIKFLADLVNERIRDRQNRETILAISRRLVGAPVCSFILCSHWA